MATKHTGFLYDRETDQINQKRKKNKKTNQFRHQSNIWSLKQILHHEVECLTIKSKLAAKINPKAIATGACLNKLRKERRVSLASAELQLAEG